jgi:hypothetical protein
MSDTPQFSSKDLLSLLNDAQAFVGKSRCSLGHSVSAVLDNAKAGLCSYCKHQFELYERLGKAFQQLPASAHEPCRGCGGVGSHNGGAISQTCKRCGGSGRTEPQHVALDMHVNSMCGWAEILAAKVGWTRQNANSFWTSYDAARTAASRPPPPAALAALAPFQHMRVDTNPEPIDALDIRALDDDGREITIGYARNHEWADKLNQAFERVRSALTKGSAP